MQITRRDAAAQYASRLAERGELHIDSLSQGSLRRLEVEQGGRMLDAAGSQALTSDQLRDLDGITAAFEMHAQALDGWHPYRNDADLTAMRTGEAQAGAREGRTLEAKIDQRLAGLDRRSAEYRQLSAMRTRLDQAIARLP